MALHKNVSIAAKTEETNLSNKIMQVVEEACRMVLELAIPEEELVKVRIHKLAIGVRDTRIEMAQVQLELNLQITELQLRAQRSTPPEVKEQRATIITEAVTAVESAVADCTQLFE